jgi:serine/threonine-protein kinase
MGGRQFGQYRLEALIGTGGMGEVFRAFDTQRYRSVAVKLLLDKFCDDSTYQERFRQESYVAAGLREPHIIPIHDFGEMEGRLFIDMRLVDGESIHATLVKHGAIAPARAVHLIGQVAEALDAAHADGLVHRDIKPSNVLVTASDFVYVVDFGVAHAMGATSTALTRSGATVGTLDYMAPERFRNRHIDGRVDVYSLSCLLHECLTGSHPFPGYDLPALMYAHVFSPPPQPSKINPHVPAEFDAVIAKGMAKDPTARFDTAVKLADAARAALTRTPSNPGPPYPIATATQPDSSVNPSPSDLHPSTVHQHNGDVLDTASWDFPKNYADSASGAHRAVQTDAPTRANPIHPASDHPQSSSAPST